MYCVMNDSLKSLQLLVQAGCNLNLLLSTAVLCSKRKCFDFLLTQDVDLNELNSSNLTPIHDSILKNNRYFVSKLLELGADVSIPNNLLPLYIATKNGSIEIVSSLLEYESPTAYLDYPKTPLYKAIKNGYLKIAYKLIEAGAIPNSDSAKSPMKMSILSNNEKSFILLLLAGATIENIISEDRLSENFKKIYLKYKCKQSVSMNSHFDNEVEQIIISYVQVQKEINLFIERTKDSSYLSNYLTPVINDINKKVVSVGALVKKIESCFKNIKNYRKEILSKQLSYFEEIEKEELEKKFNEDNNEWIELSKKTQEILLKKGSSLFPQNFIDSISTLPNQIDSSKNEIFKLFSNSPDLQISEKNVVENRALLISINTNAVKKLNQICSETHNLIISFAKVADNILNAIIENLTKMRNLIISQQQLNFDFRNSDFEVKSQSVVDNLLAEKKSQMDLDLAFLKTEKENLKSMLESLLRLIRYCVN